MAEANIYIFNYKEVAEALIKQQEIHEGLWGIYVEFGIGAANIVGPDENSVIPAAIVPLKKIGIQRFDKSSALTVDAAEINPLATEPQKSSGEAQKPRRRGRNKELA